jgi:hypothetical protein
MTRVGTVAVEDFWMDMAVRGEVERRRKEGGGWYAEEEE